MLEKRVRVNDIECSILKGHAVSTADLIAEREALGCCPAARMRDEVFIQIHTSDLQP